MGKSALNNLELKPAVLALADGRSFKGFGFGADSSSEDPAIGEVVFNTSMSGYQEILSDPSYSGQIMTFTCPHIGNVGCNEEDNESDQVHVAGIIIRSLSKRVSNFRAKESLPEYLARNKITGISGIDTRSLVLHLRNTGSQMGAIAIGEKIAVDDLVEHARSAGSMLGKNLVPNVSTKKAYQWTEKTWDIEGLWSGKGPYLKSSPNDLWSRPHIVALDCGIKRNILRLLVDSGFRVTVVPASTSIDEIKKYQADALFISNGPGDPATLGDIVEVTKGLLGQLPIFGICLGHQIISQAVGAKTYKLKFGHRGANHPVIDCKTKKVEITVQNHGFAVDKESIPKDIFVSHLNLNDQTVEGIAIPELKVQSIQYHPEASPGPHDAAYLFDNFFEMLVSNA